LTERHRSPARVSAPEHQLQDGLLSESAFGMMLKRVKLGGMNEFYAAASAPETRVISF
jgi:hypothetical protein